MNKKSKQDMNFILLLIGILVNKWNKDGEYVKFGMSKHAQWFYFGTKNFCSNLKVTFVIKNFYKKSSAYSKGMQPFVYSLRKYKDKGIAWHRAWELIWYSQVLFITIFYRTLIIRIDIRFDLHILMNMMMT